MSKHNYEYDEIEVIEKFNPNHDSLGRFASSPSGGGGGMGFLDDDDDAPWDDIEYATPRNTAGTQHPKAPTNEEIRAELKQLDKDRNLKVTIHEMPDKDKTIRAEIVGTLPGGNEIVFHDGYKIKTAEALKRFKEIYAESKATLDQYHATGYRGL